MKTRTAAVVVMIVSLAASSQAATASVDGKLAGFDAFMEKLVKDWNVPGIGVAVVA